MTPPAIDELQERLRATVEALRLAEERAAAGLLALELMHEIRNPLEALGHLVYLTSQEAEDIEKVRKYAQLSEEQVALLADIVSRTLGLARSAPGLKRMDMMGLAEAALRIHQRKIIEKNVHLVKDLPHGAYAQVFTSEMLQVISNLVVNALDAMPQSGKLYLRLRKRAGSIHIVIADNGHGIPQEHVKNIFDPFFTTKGEGGTGLGLSLSWNIIHRHKGTMRVRSSVRPGRSGTTFCIRIPA